MVWHNINEMGKIHIRGQQETERRGEDWGWGGGAFILCACKKSPQMPSNQRTAASKHSAHRRRIKTEENAKVVAVVWGTYLNAVLTI